MFNNNFGGSNFGNLAGLGANGLIEQTYDFGQTSMNSEQAGAVTISIRKIYLGMTRPQADQWRRTYDVMLDGNSMNTIQDNVARSGAEAFNPTNLSNMLADGVNFFRHSGAPDGEVSIDNGWDFDRFRFTMVVDCYRNGRFSKTEFVSGYTDAASVSSMGMTNVNIDPHMVFSVNHVTEARMRSMDATGQPVPMISRSNAVVRNALGSLGQPNNLFLTRPSDILRAVDKVELYNGMRQASELGDSSLHSYQDLDSMLTGVPMMSADTNLLVPTFTSRTLKGLYENSLSQFDPMNIDNTASGSLASERIRDTAFSASGFIHVMNRKLANNVATTGQFTFGDLLMLDPTIDDRTEVFGRAYENGSISIPDGRTVDSIAEADMVAVHATSIVQSTLALMSLSGVAVLAYNANNMMTGQTDITIQACDGMDNDGMLAQRLEVLKGRLIMECFGAVGAYEETFEVDIFADAFNDVFIQINWGGKHRAYVVPAFASSQTAPIVTNSIDRLVGMAEAIGQVVDTCKELTTVGTQGFLGSGQQAIVGNGDTRIGGLAGDY